ncbi:RecF/RecN/SMC familyt protein [Stappia sp. 22II-S9-Z10]|nr:RecF/RecN/SMC familyt protein [Stappia sp. 22II-S9-Z10]
MRFSRLAFIRYAGYTDRTLTFAPDAALHVVYGPNEAGKSSALAAISDLLFGFPHAISADFLHDAGKLRLGATLTGRSGETIAFRRRRGRKDTLLEDQDGDVAMRDDALAPWLGGLTRDIFAASFGLNSDTLRAGAEDMLKPGGELGSVVMAAASGLTGLAALRGALDEEAGLLYKPQGRKLALNEARDRFTAAEKAERAGELKGSAWRELNKAIAEAEATLAETRKAREAVVAEEKRIDTLSALRSVVAEIDAGAEALAGFADLSAVPPGLADDLSAHLAALAEAERRRGEAADAVDAARRRHGAITVDEAMAAAAAKVQAVLAESGAYAAVLDERPAVVRAREEAAAEIAACARRLGLHAAGDDPAGLAARQPADAALGRAADAAAAVREADAALEANARAAAAARSALAGLGDAAGPSLTDPRPAKASLAALADRLTALKARPGMAAALAGVRRAVEEGAAALVPAPDLADPGLAALPEAARLASHVERLREIERAGREAQARLREQKAKHDVVAQRIAAAEATGPVPSAEAITAARRARDAALGALADAATGAAPLLDAGAADTGRRLTREADDLSDQAFAEAKRVETYAALKAEAAELATDIARREADIADMRADLAAEREAFRAPFLALGLEPGRTDEMVEWRRRVADLLEKRAEADSLADELAALAAEDAATTKALAAIGAHVGLTLDDLPADAMAARLAARIGELEDAWAAGQQTLGRRDHLLGEIARLEAEAVRGAEVRETAATALAAAAEGIGLSGAATPSEVDITIGLWRELPALAAREAAAVRRLETLSETKARFEAGVAALVDALAPDLAGVAPAAACAELAERAAAARAARERRAAAAETLVTAEETLTERTAVLARTEAAADAAFAHLPDGDRVQLAARLHQRDEADAGLKACRRRFAEIAPGEDEADVRAQLARLDPNAAGARRDELSREAARLGEEENVAYAALREKRGERDRLGTGGGTEQAVFDKNAAAAEAEGIARNWAVLKIASSLLSAAIERQRQLHHGPLIKRAGVLFAMLTNGAYDGLAQRIDENDRLQLYAAKDGDVLDRAALSDGTRDQLFLALRLAIVEDYASRNEPAPFIGDDIFQTFDDDRTAAGLAALADFGATVQPILFAHHRSVVDIARDRLGERVDVIELG